MVMVVSSKGWEIYWYQHGLAGWLIQLTSASILVTIHAVIIDAIDAIAVVDTLAVTTAQNYAPIIVFVIT